MSQAVRLAGEKARLWSAVVLLGMQICSQLCVALSQLPESKSIKYATILSTWVVC